MLKKNQKVTLNFFIFLKVMLNKIHKKITNNKNRPELYNFKLQLRKKHI